MSPTRQRLQYSKDPVVKYRIIRSRFAAGRQEPDHARLLPFRSRCSVDVCLQSSIFVRVIVRSRKMSAGKRNTSITSASPWSIPTNSSNHSGEHREQPTAGPSTLPVQEDEHDDGSDEPKGKKQKFSRSRTACLPVSQSDSTYPLCVVTPADLHAVPIPQVKMRRLPTRPMSQLRRCRHTVHMACGRRSIVQGAYAKSSTCFFGQRDGRDAARLAVNGIGRSTGG